MSEIFGGEKGKKHKLKEIIKKLHNGMSLDVAKKEFKDFLKDIGPADIAQIEEELINEGMSRDEIQKLCDVHLALFKESLNQEKSLTELGHPIHILMEEHKILLEFADKLKKTASTISKANDFSSINKEIDELRDITAHFKESESHYLREENVLFPYLEKHGITQPPAIMWSEHNEIRKIKKRLYDVVENIKTLDFSDFSKKLIEISISLTEMLTSHFYKENNVLFPTGLKVIAENEWIEIRKQFDEIGYCCFTPEPAKKVFVGLEKNSTKSTSDEREIIFDSGSFSKEELETLLNTLPVDITFVDKDDSVRYFSQSKERIFPRTKAVIGRKVQLCHPKESVHRVEQILNDFRNNKRDVAEFWINLKGRLIYIRYFAVRNAKGEYLGCLEVTQDITDIKKIEGEKRLLD